MTTITFVAEAIQGEALRLSTYKICFCGEIKRKKYVDIHSDHFLKLFTDTCIHNYHFLVHYKTIPANRI